MASSKPHWTGAEHALIARKAYAKWLTDGCPVEQDLLHWTQAESELQQELRRVRRNSRILMAMLLLWLLAPVALFLYIARSDYGSNASAKLLPKKLKVFALDGKHYTTWDQAKAVEYGLDQVNTSIRYVMVAAAALLGFIVKFAADRGPWRKVQFGVAFLLLHAAMGLLFSMVCGFLALQYFTELGTLKEFSIYSEMNVWAGVQAFVFLVSCVVVIALVTYTITPQSVGTRKE